MRPLEDVDKKWMDNGRFQRHVGSGQPRYTVDQELMKHFLSQPDRQTSLKQSMSEILSKKDCIYQGMLMTLPKNSIIFGKKYLRPSEGLIPLCHYVYHLAPRLEMGQH
ncbi:hypothetical protein TNCV_629691 [Trichonephila clavipes]|nr:hypothetical protein TNCV_629691 [Trichonephila clavipes]